jgi:CheY-like chemotaxis protein
MRLRSVLVVDDHEDLRTVMAMALEDSGFAVHRAAHGGDACKLLQGGLRPSLIVLDLQMPVLSGAEFLAWLAAQRRVAATPVLLCSSTTPASEGVARSAYRAHLRKPFTTDQLLAAVDGCL